jgi:protein OS-9
MKKYNIDLESIEEMKKRLDKIAEGKDWTLEVVESNGVIKFQGAIEKDEDELDVKEGSSSSSQQSADQANVDDTAGSGSASETKQNSKSHRKASEDEAEESVGSEETFKDEL